MTKSQSANVNLVVLLAWSAVTVVLSGCYFGDDGPPAGSSSQPSLETSGQSTNDSHEHASELIRSVLLSPNNKSASKLFQRLDPDDVGIDMVNPLDTSHPLKRLYDAGFAAGGVALGDIDGDGLVDIFFASGPRGNRLYRQIADDDASLRFENITFRAKVDGGGAWGSGAVMVDIEGDGDLDIYVCNYDAANHLFVNDGQGVFSEQAERAGLAIKDASLFPAFADYDNDGDLDCYLLTNRLYDENGLPKDLPARRVGADMQLLPGFERYYRLKQYGPTQYRIKSYGRLDYLLRNDGEGRFTDVTQESGIFGDGLGNSVTWCDFNQDGWIDIYVANDGDDPDRLYGNNGDGSFQDVAPFCLPHTTWFSMGSDAGDLDNDGRPDLFVVDMSSTTHYKQKTTMGAMNNQRLLSVAGPPQQLMRNAVFFNSGLSRFREGAYLTGLADSDWSWAAKLADFDCDGRLDIFISNGVARNFMDSDLAVPEGSRKGTTFWEQFESSPPRPEQNLAFRNQGDLSFEDVSSSWGLDHLGMSYATAYGDLDNDGDLDLVVVNLYEPVRIYRNDGNVGHRVIVRLEGRDSNAYGLGATVTIQTASGRQVRQLSPMTGFLSSNDPRVHFGTGEDTTIDRLEVQWPGGARQTFVDLPTDRIYTITQPARDDEPADRPSRRPTKPFFRPSKATDNVDHHENAFNDFSRQPLLPNKLSQLGPSLAIGDVNGDGREDLFIGGAVGTSGQLFLNQDGRFTVVEGGPFDNDRAAEDMGAVLLDVDRDGDLDLYVVSGGYEFEEDAEQLRDRLYLNHGEARFQRAPESALPDIRDSGSCVVASDFDRDGDLDLFVGGRVIPGRYPLSPNSRLLRNDSTSSEVRFTDVTDKLAPGLQTTGLVTGALWSDANNDGWPDLLVTHEWGPVKVFLNSEGTFEDRTVQAGTSELLGWWNGITGRDIDGDEDIDYVVTNFGLNTKYHVSRAKPAYLYYGDLDGSGQWRLVEAEYEGNKLFPIRGKSCSTHAMPHLGEKFKSYHDFALADLMQIYTPQCLDDAHRYEATTLESGVLLNNGAGKFVFQPLPRIAQISPAFGVTLTEINGDGHPDAYLVQNFFSPQLETGLMAGGLSQALLGRGDGSFMPIAPNRSGLVVPGDGMSLVRTDLDGDRRPDFVVGVNDNQSLAFEHQGNGPNQIVQVRLWGDQGNATAVGAKVTLRLASGRSQTAEVYAGDGYLSQSSPLLSFGIPAEQSIQLIDVRWPDGSNSQHKPESPDNLIIMRKER